MAETIDAVQTYVQDHAARKRVYHCLIVAWENSHCDTLGECVGADPAFDEAWKDIHPDEDGDD